MQETLHKAGLLQQIDITDNLNDLYKRISDYDLSFVVERLVDNDGYTREKAMKLVEELKKFLFICIVENDKPIAMLSSEVDDAWHNFILFTKEYQNFCFEIAGRFLHHSPFSKDTDKSTIQRSGRNFIKAYKKYFGDLDPIWLKVEASGMCERDPEKCYEAPCKDKGCSGGRP